MNEAISPKTSERQSQISKSRFTQAEVLEIWKNRERAAELHAIGKTYPEIAEIMGCAVSTAHRWVQTYFKQAARYYRAPVMREVMARTYRYTIRRCQEQIELIGADKDQTAAVMLAIDRMHDALAGLGRIYGMQGGNAFDLELPISVAEAAGPHASPWAKELPPEKLQMIRARMLDLYRQLPTSAVPGSFAEEVQQAEVVEDTPPVPSSEEGETTS